MLTCHLWLKVKSKTECRQNVHISREDKTFTTSVYRKPTFSGVYTHFDNVLPSTYNFNTVYTLAYRCLRIYSSWTKLDNELVCLKEIFLKNGYPEDFIKKCSKKFMDNIHVVKETTLTVEKKPLVLLLPYLGSIYLQTRTKLKKSLKNILNCCKVQIVFKSKTRLGNNFISSIEFPMILLLVSFINFSVGSAMSPIMVNAWDTWMLELINIFVYHHLPKNKLSLRTAP